jgi:hypothetical protein
MKMTLLTVFERDGARVKLACTSACPSTSLHNCNIINSLANVNTPLIPKPFKYSLKNNPWISYYSLDMFVLLIGKKLLSVINN